jgi:hypothetical protein
MKSHRTELIQEKGFRLDGKNSEEPYRQFNNEPRKLPFNLEELTPQVDDKLNLALIFKLDTHLES